MEYFYLHITKYVYPLFQHNEVLLTNFSNLLFKLFAYKQFQTFAGGSGKIGGRRQLFLMRFKCVAL